MLKKSENGLTEWTVMMKLCIHIDIDKMQPKKLSNVILDWPRRCRGSDSEKQ